ncbi:uncharacterized protein A4U43_C03F8800 [Asparagus officinalis]|uniref:Uncharacterized protein n=2 Tax=Asparagus officinalis TaxID=4686 RepID=A0A5P1F8F0_ASPOF|nr:uncharacterized protein A4U43_C03F8800 [Asparagus officinalis]
MKRVGSFLCFGPPDTNDTEKDEKRQSPAKVLPEVGGNGKQNRRRLMSKFARSISLKSNSLNRRTKSTKDSTRPLSGEISDSSENNSTSESFGKNTDVISFSSSLSSSSFSSSSSSCVSSASQLKLQQKKAFIPPPAQQNYGYATGLLLVLMSLFVVVFCGRLCAILWTATWLCTVPRRRKVVGSSEFSEGTAVSAVAKAEMRRKGEYYWEEGEKNRIVLEGFLRRNRKGGVK